MNVKVQKFIEKELNTNLTDVLFIKNDDGSYELFNKFLIIPENGNYRVYSYIDNENVLFTSLKHAVTWCVFNKIDKKKESKRIQELDGLLGSTTVSILMCKKLIKSKRIPDDKLIYVAKMTEEKRRRKKAEEELSTYVNYSKYWQTKKFAGTKS